MQHEGDVNSPVGIEMEVEKQAKGIKRDSILNTIRNKGNRINLA